MTTDARNWCRRDVLERHIAETPQGVAMAVQEYEQSCNGASRRPTPGHRTYVTPSVVLVELGAALRGDLGLGAQISIFRKIEGLKPRAHKSWARAAELILTDLALRLDPKLHTARAARIGCQTTDVHRNFVVHSLQDWLREPAL
jgi:hypothetical protein